MSQLNSYPVITYSINKRSAQYSYHKLSIWRHILNWFQNKMPAKIFEGYHYQAEICLCAEALDYFKPADIIQIKQKLWLIEARGQGFLNVRTVEITRQLAPIQIGDPVFKLYSIYTEGGTS